MSDVSDDVIVQWTRENAQRINDEAMSLDELKDVLGADSVEMITDEEYQAEQAATGLPQGPKYVSHSPIGEPSPPDPRDTITTLLTELKEVGRDLKAAAPVGMMGEFLAAFNKSIQLNTIAGQWAENSAQKLEEALGVLDQDED